MPIGFTDRMELVCERRGRVRDDAEDFSLSKGWMELPFTEMGRRWQEHV